MQRSRSRELNNQLNRILHSDEFGVLIPLLVIMLVTTIFKPNFLSLTNVKVMFIQIPFIAIVALGASLPLMTGHVDISTGRVAGFAGIIMSVLVVDYKWTAVPAIAVALIFAVLIGYLNGILVVRFHIPDFVATMGTLYIIGGARYLCIKGYQLSLNLLEDFPLTGIFAKRYLGMPIYFWILILIVVITFFIIKRTVWGRQILATGDNQEVARLAGINTDRICITAYMISALFAAIAGILLTLDIGIGLPETGDGWEFRAIAGCVVGGTSLSGGKSSPLGTLIGVTLITVAESAIIFMGAPTTMRIALRGALMALAVLFDIYKQNRKVPA